MHLDRPVVYKKNKKTVRIQHLLYDTRWPVERTSMVFQELTPECTNSHHLHDEVTTHEALLCCLLKSGILQRKAGEEGFIRPGAVQRWPMEGAAAAAAAGVYHDLVSYLNDTVSLR